MTVVDDTPAVEPAATAAARAALESVWDLVCDGVRTLVVDSPPGAGKSTLVRQVARRLVAVGEQVPVVAQTNDQADDLAYRLAGEVPEGVTVGRLYGGTWSPRSRLPANLVASSRVDDLEACAVLVATAAKWAFVAGREWPLGIIDEAYQMSSAALVRVAGLFDRLLLVGDPGQLEPFTVADERIVRRVAAWPLDTAAGTVLRNHPDTPVVPLPVSWRLPPSAAEVVSEAFYTRRLRAGVGDGARALGLPVEVDADLAEI
ncbi:MAG: AAA family ATPase, partial [Micromonosporaceae bacterium]